MDLNQIQSEMSELRRQIQWHDRLYYQEAKPQISDREYDALYARLKQLEEEYPQFITADSPTQRVSGQPLSGFVSKPHIVPMLSLDNSYNAADIQRFHESVRKTLADEQFEYIIEPKIDGVSISLRYENGLFVQALTRGNGREGDDVSANVRTIASVPLRLQLESPPAVLEARGEVFMNRAGFAQLNRRRQEAGEEAFANPRNASAGTLKLLDARVVAQRPLQVLFYAQGEMQGASINSQEELLALFKQAGLMTQNWLRKADDFAGIQAALEELQETKNSFPYDIDGAVIKINLFAQRLRLGQTAKAPSWARAYKYEPERAATRLTAISVQVGRSGVLTPVAELEPVFLAGSTISRATLHNEEEIKRKDIRIGDSVLIEKAGEIIPAVVSVQLQHRPVDSRPFDFVAHLEGKCPSCGSAIVRDPQFVAWRCPNLQCPAQNMRRIEYFAARNALDITSLGSVVAEALLEKGLVEEPLDLFKLELSELGSLNLGTVEEPRTFGEKNAAKLLQALEDAKKLPLSNWLFAMGIPEVGAATAFHVGRTHQNLAAVANSPKLKLLANLAQLNEGVKAGVGNKAAAEPELGELFAWRKLEADDVFQAELVTQLLADGLLKPSQGSSKAYVSDGIGPKAAQSLLDFFDSEIGQNWLTRMAELGIDPQGENQSDKGTDDAGLSGKTFVLTGTLNSMDRNTAADRIRAKGGTVSSAVSSKTSYLVAGENTGAKKSSRAQELGIRVINEEELLRMLGEE
ncbi:MAG: NAD-dependent DNA ligase LigA [Oligosphaeraceae bacterium]|nr:NAD-dependent DNA ligase LigA [Oligosphaeraceae bacterium]